MYRIYPRQIKIARALKVKIAPSKVKNKKIAVYSLNNRKICDIGDVRYLDYCQYLELYGREVANKRKLAYWLRHRKDINYTCGFFSANILWS